MRKRPKMLDRGRHALANQVDMQTKIEGLEAKLAENSRTQMNMQRAMQEGFGTTEEALRNLQADLDASSQQHCRNNAELCDQFSKSVSELNVKLQAELLQSANKSHFHTETEIARLQAALEVGDQTLRTEMEEALKLHGYEIKDNHSTTVGSIRVLDA